MTRTAPDYLTMIENRLEKGAVGTWRKRAEALDKQYSLEESKTRYNLLYSNTEVMLPVLFSNTPVPDCRPKALQPTPEDFALSNLCAQVLKSLIDPGTSGVPPFSDVGEEVTRNALVTGLCSVRIREHDSPTGIRPFLESTIYDRFVWGYCRKWQDCPWIALGVDISLSDAKARYPKKAEALKEIEGKDEGSSSEQTSTGFITIWQVWDKAQRVVCEVADGVEQFLVDPVAPPVNYTGFYPVPAPLVFARKLREFVPVPLYDYYRGFAEELEEVTNRLTHVVKAIRVKGAASGTFAADINRIFTDNGDENVLVPIGGALPLSPEGMQALDKQIWMMDLSKLMQVAVQLQSHRQSLITNIYEVCGLGDITRGSSRASESATAQGLKDKYYNLRTSRSQERVAVFVRDALRLLLEHVAAKMPKDQLEALVGAPIPQGLFEQFQSKHSGCYIDIETDSTVDQEAVASKEDTISFLQALGQATPLLVELSQAEGGIDASKMLLADLCQQFRLGRKGVDALMRLQPPPKPDPDADMKAEAARHTREIEHKERLNAMALQNTEELERIRGQFKLDLQAMIQEAAAATKSQVAQTVQTSASAPMVEVLQAIAAQNRLLLETIIPAIQAAAKAAEDAGQAAIQASASSFAAQNKPPTAFVITSDANGMPVGIVPTTVQ